MVSNTNFIRQADIRRNSLTRYNQGFLKFGPMEQAEEGEWLKAEPALLLIDQCLTELELNDTTIEDLYDDKTMLEDRIYALKATNFLLGVSLAVSMSIIIVFILKSI